MHIHPIIKSTLLSILMSLVCFVLGCKRVPKVYKDDFYNQRMLDETKRLPIKKPYLLTSIFSESWMINFTDQSLPTSTHVDIIYMNDGVLWGYGKSSKQINSNHEFIRDLYTYFIINTNTGTEYKYIDSLDYEAGLKEYKKINPTRHSRSDLDSIYNQFSKNGILPWYNEK